MKTFRLLVANTLIANVSPRPVKDAVDGIVEFRLDSSRPQ